MFFQRTSLPKIFYVLWKIPSPKKAVKVLLFLFLSLILLNQSINNIAFPRFASDRTFGGDEPKYFRMVDSLMEDGDLDLSNLWESDEKRGDVEEGPNKNVLQGLYFVGRNGGIYPLHMPGLAFLMLPAYVLDATVFPNDSDRSPEYLPFLPFRLRFTRLFLLGMALLTLFLLFRLLGFFIKSLFLTTSLLILFILNSPFLSFSYSIYPAALATFLCLLVMNSIFCPFKKRFLNILFIIVGIGYLPWLHQRYILLSLGLFLSFLLSRKSRKIPWMEIFIIIFALLILTLPYFYYFYSLTGDPSPLSTSKLHGKVYARWNTMLLGFFGSFFPPTKGFLWSYPWVILFFFGIYWGFKKEKKLTLKLLLLFLPYYFICSAAIPWGFNNRFLLPVFPVFLILSGMTILDVYKKFSYPKVVFYLLFS